MLNRRLALLTFSAAALAACERPVERPASPPEAEKEEDPRPRAYALLNQPAAPFTLPKLGGGEGSLSDYAGRVVILSFGGLWCPDCILDGEAVSLVSQWADADPDVDFLEIHTRNRFGRWGPNERERAGATPYNAEESAAALNAYFAETGHSYPIVFDPTRDWSRDAYKIEWYPTYLIVDRAGVIRGWRTDLDNEAGARALFDEAKRIASA